jgi:DegV family protein with EDD domain
MTIKIVADSTCDLPQQVIKAFDITIVPMFINIGERGYLDGIDISREDFYSNLPDYKIHPTTGTPGVKAFTDVFASLTAGGADEILTIHISKSLSAVCGVAEAAAREFTAIPVTVRDSGQLSLGIGFQVELAARMAKAGKNMQKIIAALDDLKRRTFVAAGLDTLEYLRRSGRMNIFLAGIGSLLQLKPILTMRNGLPASEKVRTSQKAGDRLIAMLAENLPVERFAFVHTHAAIKVDAFKLRIGNLIPKKDELLSVDITPVIGVHLGPGAVGFALVSK